MRELKFRAWSLGNRMKGIEPHYIEDFAIDAFYGTPKDIFDGNRSEDGIECIEQYTGLKDKNGKEIYEGDIVKFTDLELAMKPTGVVCFSNGKFFVKDWEFGDGSYHIVDFYDYNIPHRDFEVIGNIHENPELPGGKE